MGAPKHYDPKRIFITWAPIAVPDANFPLIKLNRGIADGTFITLSREVVMNTRRTGGDGEGTRIKSNNKNGLTSVTLRNGSDTNFQLSKVLGVYEATNLGNIGVLTVTDFEGDSIYTSPYAYLEGWPEKSYSEGSEDDLVWNFLCHDLVMFHGGNNSIGT